jgi:hypothetical protein
LTSQGYLHRLNERRQLSELKQAVLFGLIIGWMMTLVGAFHFFFMLEGQAWLYTCCFGIALLAATVVLPEVISFAQRFVQRIAAFVTGYLLKGVCATIYFIAVLPLGLLFQKTKGTHPFYTWTDAPPESGEGWVDKRITASSRSGSSTGFWSFLTQPIHLVQYFATNAQAILLPCLIICLVVALIAIFAESSVMAPLIYTLF